MEVTDHELTFGTTTRTCSVYSMWNEDIKHDIIMTDNLNPEN